MQPYHAWCRQGSEAVLLSCTLEVVACFQNIRVAKCYRVYELYEFYFRGEICGLLEKDVREVMVAPLFFNERSHMQGSGVGANNVER